MGGDGRSLYPEMGALVSSWGLAPRVFSAAFPKGAEEGAKMHCWGADDALRGFSKSKGSPPCTLTPTPQTPSVPVLGAAVEALGELRGRAGRAGEDWGELLRRRAPCPAPSQSPLLAAAALLAPRQLARSPLPPPRRAPRSVAASPPTPLLSSPGDRAAEPGPPLLPGLAQ